LFQRVTSKNPAFDMLRLPLIAWLWRMVNDYVIPNVCYSPCRKNRSNSA
jgi:hypothetical protein